MEKLKEEEKQLRSKLQIAEIEHSNNRKEISKISTEVQSLRDQEQQLEKDYATLKVIQIDDSEISFFF